MRYCAIWWCLLIGALDAGDPNRSVEEKTEDILERLSEANAKEAKWKRKQEKAMKRLEKVTGKLYEGSSISLKSAGVNDGAAIFEGRPDFVELQQDVELEQTLFTDDEANNDNHILLEDDIIIPVDHQPRNEEEQIATILNAVKDPARLWPKDRDGIVRIPYLMERNKYNQTSVNLIQEAMDVLRKYTCISFEQRRNENDFVRIAPVQGCAASVGKRTGRNDIYLDQPNCMKVGIIIHELLHIVGFNHEQSRSDRDDYVDIIFDNIVPGSNYRVNFNKAVTNNLVVYDYNSVLHYPRLSWNKKPYLQTIVPKTMPKPKIGQRDRLSPLDIEEVRGLYSCSKSSYAFCGGELDTEGTFKSNKFPNGYEEGEHCTWKLTARKGAFVELTFDVVDLYESYTCEDDAIIVHDGDSPKAQAWRGICGQKTNLKITSTGQSLYVIFATEPGWFPGKNPEYEKRKNKRGFKASFKTVHWPGDGPPPIQGNDYGPKTAKTEDDFFCDFHYSYSKKNDAVCGMESEGLIADFKWEVGRGYSKSDKTGYQKSSKKDSTSKAVNYDDYSSSSSIKFSDVDLGYNGTSSSDDDEDRWLFFNSKDRQVADTASIMTPWLSPTSKCINFDYLMHSTDQMGTLNVKSVEINNRGDIVPSLLTEITGKQGINWKNKHLKWEPTITNLDAVKFIFEGWVYGEWSDILIDNLNITKGCSADDLELVETYECAFENEHLCGATHGETEQKWNLNKGQTPSKSTGPIGDHTTGSGMYLFLEASQPAVRGDRLQLKLPPLTETEHCLSFWYHMYGQETGSLRAKIKLGENGLERVLWEQSGERLDKWYRMEVEIEPKFFLNDAGKDSFSYGEEVKEDAYQFDPTILTSSKGSSSDGLPIYDYETEDYESSESEMSESRKRRQAYDNDVAIHHTGSDGNGATGILMTDADFADMLEYIQTMQDEMQMDAVKRIASKAGKGVFITIEGERGHGYRGDMAIDDVRVTNSRCSIWTDWTGWNQCSHTCGGGVQIRERECTLKNIEKCNGDFKENRSCNMHPCDGWSCNFNKGLDDKCAMRQSPGMAKHDWIVHSGYTPTEGTGPQTDVSGKGGYIFLEASKPARPGDNAMIATKKFEMDSDYCLNFYYHMWTTSTVRSPMGELKVYMIRNGQRPDKSTMIWYKSGDQGKNWINARISVKKDNKGPFMFLFEATRGNSYKSDIGLDEISLIPSDCNAVKQFDENSLEQRVEALVADLALPKGLEMCDMNKKNIHQCGWSQLGGRIDAVDFKRTASRTPSDETGPEAGRGPIITKNYDQADQYLYLEASDVENGQGARIKSIPMASIPYCVSLDYHMWGSGTGSLAITALEKTQSQVLDIKTTLEGEEDDEEEDDDKASRRELVVLKGDKGNLWNNLRYNYRPTNESFQVAFDVFATRGDNFKSDIAIDNLVVRPGPCIEIVSVGTDEFHVRWGAVENLLTFEVNVEPPIQTHTNGNTTVTEIKFIRFVSPDTDYKITLKTITKDGDNIEEYNSEATFRTLPKLGIMLAANTKSRSTQLIRLKNDDFAGYEITVWPESESFKNGLYMDLSIWESFEAAGIPQCGGRGENCVQTAVGGLRGGSTHNINIRGIGKGGSNYKSNIVKIVVSTGPLPPPHAVRPMTTEFQLGWQNPKGSRGTVIKIDPKPAQMSSSILPPTKDNLIIKGLEPDTEFNITMFVIGYLPVIPKSAQEFELLVEKHALTKLSDEKTFTVRTGPEPPKLSVVEQRKDSVKIDWSDYAESDEASYLVHLNPSNGQLFEKAQGVNRPVEVMNKFLTVGNLHPDIEYTLTLSAKLDDTYTDEVQIKFKANCERSHYQMDSKETTKLGPYNLGDYWTVCTWARAAPSMPSVLSLMQPSASGVSSVLSLSTTASGWKVNVGGKSAEKEMSVTDLSFICVTQDSDEQEHRIFVNSEQIEASSSAFEKITGAAVFVGQGPSTIIDANVWPFVLSDTEINIQRTSPIQCISGMITPSVIPPSTHQRSPPRPEISVVSTSSSQVEVNLESKGLITSMFVELSPPSAQFKNGIKSGSDDKMIIKGLDSDTNYSLTIVYLLAAQKSEAGQILFRTATEKPVLTAPSVESSLIYLQWDEIPGAIAYELVSSEAQLSERLNETYYHAEFLNGSTEYTFEVRAVIDDDENIRTDYAKTTISTVPSLDNFSAKARSTSLRLTWDVATKPDFYNVLINPPIPNFDGYMVELESPLLLDGASPNTIYSIVMTATYSSSGASGYQGKTDKVFSIPKTAPLLENSRVALLQSSQIAIALGYVMGAKDLRVVVEPPIASITNGLQGGFANFVRLTQMIPLTKYEIAISALVANAETDAVIFTEETAPSGSGVNIEEITSSSVQVSWSAVEHVIRYRVILKKGSQTVYDAFKDANELSIVLSYLEPESSYNVFISGEMENQVRTDPASQRFTTLPQVTGISAKHIASTSFTVEWPEVEGVTRWDFKVVGEVTIHLSGMHSATVTNLLPGTDYSLSLVGIFDEVRRTDIFYKNIMTASAAPQVDITNVQSTAFNILWKSVPNAQGYDVAIEPPVDDFDNSLVDSSTSYLSIFEAEPNTQYTVSIKAIFNEIVETDRTVLKTQTAFTLESPKADFIGNTTASISWVDHRHEEEKEAEREGSADHDDHLGVINYFVSINPPPIGGESRNLAMDSSFSFTNLEEGTTYVVEVIAVLTSGAQTDISDFEFTTNGKSRELVDSSVQCGFESLERKSSSSCDFEGGGLCGWTQSSKRFGFFRWRVDTERNTLEKNKILVAPLNRNANLNSARIMSPARKGTQCLSLRALIFQQTSLNLSVKVRFAVEGEERKREETIISYNGNQGGDWFNVQQTVFMPPTISYQVVIEATKSEGKGTPIAIDDLKLESGPCWSKDEL
ncbi:Oidioi.mRNA.OKI2018_I69.chr1.g2173.t1.cds [Oikopleura dioica]|uniref:Metalloendopeptidase n=1 Tax=Oikopleura dioica TaxID=34765 RepID=A0ABN7SQA7_OIKDI|nr:Oidioi.mRNA.OKI2018_I69.chr1.g2173.t1.cds [Oikopleura dioica]